MTSHYDDDADDDGINSNPELIFWTVYHILIMVLCLVGDPLIILAQRRGHIKLQVRVDPKLIIIFQNRIWTSL